MILPFCTFIKIIKDVDTEFFDFELDAITESNRTKKQSSEVFGLQACDLIKKKLQHKCFPVSIANLLRTSILKNTFARLLLQLPSYDHIEKLHCSKLCNEWRILRGCLALQIDI